MFSKIWQILKPFIFKILQIKANKHLSFFVEDRTDQVYNQASSTSSQETKADQHIETNIQGKQVCFDFFY